MFRVAGLALTWIVLASLPALGQSPVPSNVADCRPCSFSPGAGLPNYSFVFDLKTEAQGRAIQSIEVLRDTSHLQRLLVTGMEAVGNDEPFFFGGVDINFDGRLDLMLITRRGVANAYAEYWLFNPATGTFDELGTYPVFRVNAEKRRLSTYERGGYGGLVYVSKEYSFVEGRLVLQREETQDATAKSGVFRKVVRERVGGAMKTIRTEMVTAPKSSGMQ